MNRKEIIRDFRRKAEIVGKPLVIEPIRHGKMRIVCNGQSVILPNISGEIKNHKLFEHRLGLHAALSRA